MKKIVSLTAVLLTNIMCMGAWDWESVKMSMNPDYRKVEEKTTTKYVKKPDTSASTKQEVSKRYKTKKDGSEVKIQTKEKYVKQ